MDEGLLKQHVAVGCDLDRVVLISGRTRFPMPYAQAFKVSAGLRLASKQAMKLAGEGISGWRSRSVLDNYAKVPEIAKEQRTTLTQQYKWKVTVDGEMVSLFLNEQQLSFHFTATLKLAEWLRFAGKKAKLWAGDSGRTMVSAGNLQDAEFNYKHGF